MEDFTPSQGYDPEDEYTPLETAQEPQAPAHDRIAEPFSPEPAEPIDWPVPNRPAYQQPAPQPFSYYRQAPQEPVYPQPNQSPMPQPQSYSTQNYIPQGYPQQPQQGWQIPPYVPQQQQKPAQPPTVPPMPQPYTQPQPSANPYQQNPYAQNNAYRPQERPLPYQQPKSPKPPMSAGTKVFIIVLCALLVAMIAGFIVYVSAAAGNKNHSDRDNASSGYNDQQHDGDDDTDNNFDFNYNPFTDQNSFGSSTEIADEITLKEDNGETQQRDDDNADTVGKPDEKAASLALEKLPKDADSDKYTTQSAYESVSDSVVTVQCFDENITDNDRDIVSSGTGTVISADGYIITNAHVIGNSKLYAINIVMNNSDAYQAKVIGYDTWTDLAVLKIDAKDLKAVHFGDSALINIGDEVIAIGSPGGIKFQNSLTKGIVSAVDRELSINRSVRYIQSDAAINPGNSGGPLCNIYGQVIGITTAKTIATNYENMSFSIPSDTVKTIVDDLMRYGYVKGRARIGFSGTEISQEEMYYYGYPAGVMIAAVDESGALAGTDLKEGDIITELDGIAITSFQDIYDVLADHKAGDKLTIKAIRFEN